MKTTPASAILLFALLGNAALPAAAQEGGVRVDIDKITCREMLKMTGEERDFTLIFFHGFLSGRQNQLVFDGPTLTEATEGILDACIAGPDETLLSVFETSRG